MTLARTIASGITALSLVAASGVACAEPIAAAKPVNAASKLSLAASPSLAGIRAANLKKNGASQAFHAPLWVWIAGIGFVGLGIGVLASQNSSKSP